MVKLKQCVTWTDLTYWCIGAIVTGLFARPLAISFAKIFLPQRALAATGYFCIAICLTFLYCSRRPLPSRTKVTIGAFAMLISASVVYSIARQQLVLIVYPACFCLPGAIFGSMLAWHESEQSVPMAQTSSTIKQ